LKITLVTGGTRSGKSGFAESLLKDQNNVLYIATSIVTDKEMENRIKRHIERRNQNWTTVEAFKDLNNVAKNHEEKYILLDCVTIMITNLMFELHKDYDNFSIDDTEKLYNEIKKEFDKLLLQVKEENKEIILVTNEVGYGIVPEYKISRVFRDIAGEINSYIASLSDDVYLVACGIPLKIK
jgi:adenosylcobinamide kinase/adenosylcobinamide-phosphate guanylyltransferase